MISKKIRKSINLILKSAYEEGRNSLYEYEVYGILELIGLKIPAYKYINDSSMVDEKVIAKFDGSIVIKIVSPQIAHKQKFGGVRIVQSKEPQYLKEAMNEMKQCVLSHFDDGNKPDIKGFLLTEFVSFSQSLGNEVLFGFKQDFEFGPVITLSKGGDDSEFFAKYYNPANLFLSPMNKNEALEKLAESLNIVHKYKSLQKTQYLNHLAETVSALSYLAYQYSEIADEKEEFIFTAMDINPFVLTKDDRFVAVDGFAEFRPASRTKRNVREVNAENLISFFRPKGIAVIGVSADMNKYNIGREIGVLLQNCKRKDLYFVNAKGGSVSLGDKEYKLYKSICDVEADIDLAVYAAPTKFSFSFFQELKQKKIDAVIFISGIPSGMQYSDFKSKLCGVIPKGVRVIGPNCMGVFCAADANHQGLNTIFIEEKKLEIKSCAASNTVLMTQSGALAVTIIDRLNNNRLLKAVVSFGNKCDVNTVDLIFYFENVDTIDVIALYIEGMDEGEGREFFDKVKTISKPVIVYKSGKTEAGAKAAASHTASMSGSYDVFKAACKQAGVVLAERIEDLDDYVKIFSLYAHKKIKGNKIAGVFNAGFETTLAADELERVKQAQLSESTVQKLQNADTNGLVEFSSSFLDITPMADDKMYADFIEALIQDDDVDCVIVGIVPHAKAIKSLPENCRDADGLAGLLSDISKKYDKPIVISVNAGTKYLDFTNVMEELGLPVYRDVTSALRSINRFVVFNENKMKRDLNLGG